MATITTRDGANVFYKDWGVKDAQPIVFHHGWPLSADDWDAPLAERTSSAGPSGPPARPPAGAKVR